MQLIPAIDIINGKCVRLTQGDYNQKKEYAENPAAVAKTFEEAGIQKLHVVDLEGAKASKPVNLDSLRAITTETNLSVDFGGGVKSNEAIEAVFEAGAQQITAGSIAVKQPELVTDWIAQYGAEKIILGADVIGEQIATHGWQENSGVVLFNFLEQFVKQSIEYCICTDVSKDGLLQGPAFDLYARIMKEFPDLKLIASGGVSKLGDLKQLAELGVYGTIVGKAFYEGRISLEELAQFNRS